MPRLDQPHLLGLFRVTAVDDQNRSWVQIMVTTNGQTLQNGGKKFRLDRADLETYAADLQTRAGQIALDYDHSFMERGDSRAAGWFTGATEIRDPDGKPELWAEVEWTPRAAQEIRDGEYRFISPEFSFAERDDKGVLQKAKELVAAALTNRPFFRGMAAVTLTDRPLADVIAASDVVWRSDEGLEFRRQRLYAALNPGSSIETSRFWVVDVAEAKALVQEYANSQTWVVPYTLGMSGEVEVASRSDWTEARQEWVATATEAARSNGARRPFNPNNEKEHDMDLKVIAKSLGLPEDADEQAVTAALAEQKQKTEQLQAEVDTLKAADADRIKKLEEQVESERTLRLTTERDTELAKATEDGRIVPAEKDALIAAFGGDKPTNEQVTALKTVLAARPKNERRERGSGGPAATDADTTAAKGDFTYSTGAKEIGADDESLTAHVEAEKILAAEGKHDYSADEYARALSRVARGERAPAAASA